MRFHELNRQDAHKNCPGDTFIIIDDLRLATDKGAVPVYRKIEGEKLGLVAYLNDLRFSKKDTDMGAQLVAIMGLSESWGKVCLLNRPDHNTVLHPYTEVQKVLV